MKFIDEYRSIETVKMLTGRINFICTKEWTIMEICGGQTHTIMKYGIEDLLPEKIRILHGPGCPVCVTPIEIIDKAISLSLRDNVIMASYGDMLRVPGSGKDLLYAKAMGADIRIIYSPLDALKIAEKEKNKNVVIFAIGFETTAPANALALLCARKKNMHNVYMLSSHMIILPAVELILSTEGSLVQGFLAPGHVCTITGLNGFYNVAMKYHIPIVVTGFEPIDILQGILGVIDLLETNKYGIINQYARSVRQEGNLYSKDVIEEVFNVADTYWRGIGMIPKSGLKLKEEFAAFDAEKAFKIETGSACEPSLCIAGEILRGVKKPYECKSFGSKCTPLRPLGAPMVSAEGACSAYYNFNKEKHQLIE